MNATTHLASVGPGPIQLLEVVGNAIVGGMETYVERLVGLLPRERFEITALCPSEGEYADRLRALGLDVLVLAMPDDPAWSSIQRTCSLVRSKGVDVLHAHMTNGHALAAIVGQLTGTPVLATIHTRELTMLDLEIHHATGTHLLVLSRQGYLHALGVGVGAGQLSCIPNGVDTKLFHPKAAAAESGPHPADELRAQFGIPAEAPLVGFVGRLSGEKGPEVFLRAALLLRHHRTAPHFVLIGDGLIRDWLESLVQQYRLEDRVHFALLRSGMPGLYRELDFLVSSSFSEGMPLAVMEAMASGLPVVATRVGGVPDIVADAETGWLVNAGDFEAIAARAARLLDSPELLRRMGAAARQRIVDRFELAGSAAKTAEALARLASQRTAPRKFGGRATEGVNR